MSSKHLCACLVLLVFSSVSYCDINVLTNPGFESGGTGGWSLFYSYGSSMGVTNSPVHSGLYAGRVYNRQYWWQGITQNLGGKMAPEETYSISAWVRTSSTSSYADMYIVQMDSGNPYNYIDYAPVNNTGWTELSGNFTLDANSSASELILLITCDGDVTEFFIDDVNVFGPEPPPPAGQVNANIRHQILEGFGASGAWEESNVLSYSGDKEKLYDVLFKNSGLDIYRDRNTYGYNTGRLYGTANIVAKARERNPELKIMISSWGPPSDLKSNGKTTDGGTLAKDINGNYRYDDFAQWWMDSLYFYSLLGVNADYINIQNEPNYVATWESCLFDPYETATCAGFNVAFETVWQKLNTEMGESMPKMLAAEVRGIWLSFDYFDNLLEPNHAYGYAHHLYGDTSVDNPDGANSAMRQINTNYGDRPLMQTEFSKSDDVQLTWTDAMNLGILMHNSLVIEEVTVYLYWELFWSSLKGLVTVSGSSYTINPVYYPFKHFAYFTDPGWQRVETTTNTPGVRMSAFISPDEKQLSVILINTSNTDEVTLNLSFDGFIIAGGDIYRSNGSLKCEMAGNYDNAGPITLPPYSITTLTLGNPEYCEPPAVPTGLTATAQSEMVVLDWDDNSDEDFAGYNLYRSLTSGSDYEKLNDVLLTDSNYIDNDVVPGNTYYYVVTAVDIITNESDYSDQATADAFDSTPPAAPVGLVVSPGSSTVLLDWNDNSEEDFAGYNVYRSAGSGYEKINTSLLVSSTYTDNTVSDETIYYYFVTALDLSSNESDNSNKVVTKPGAPDHIYNFIGVTAADANKDVYACDVDVFPFLGLSGNRNTMVEATDAQYDAVSVIDAEKWTTVNPSVGDEIFIWVEMQIDEPVSEIGRIEFTFVGNTAGSGTIPHSIYILKAGADWTQNNSWVQLGTLNITGGIDGELTGFIGPDIQSYIDESGKVTWGVYETLSATTMSIDYLQAAVYLSVLGYQTCADIQSAGFRLVSDLNGDCYVDFNDLQVVTSFWFETNCGSMADCDGADFSPRDGYVDFADYSNFAADWMMCNNPADSNCIKNWQVLEQ